MRNPFVVTGVVDDPSFCNRQREQAELNKHIGNSQNVLLFSHRRYGKTSLILRVFRQLRNVAPIYVDLYGTTSVDDFIKALIRGASVLEPKGSRFIKLIRKSISGLSLSFGFDPISQSPNISVSFDREPSAADIESVFQLVGTVTLKKKIVVAFDEFQEVSGFGSDKFEKELRKIIQHHKNVSYIFAGSQRHLLTSMFTDSNRAFYQLALRMPLERIETEDYVDWIQGLYGQAGKGIDADIIRDIVARCDNHPKYVQEFFYTLWPANKASQNQINKVEDSILEKRSVEFMNIWDSLTLNQKKVLKLLVSTAGTQLFSAENLARIKLKTASQVSAAIKFLEKRELISKKGTYQIYDPVFHRWIKRLG